MPRPAYTGEQIRQAEAPLLKAGEGDRLMRRAAGQLAAVCRRVLRLGGGTVYGRRVAVLTLSLIHISEPTRLHKVSRMPSSA